MEENIEQKYTPSKSSTVTPLSKYLAIALFIILPFIGFYLGMLYEKSANNIMSYDDTIELSTTSTNNTTEPAGEQSNQNNPYRIDQWNIYQNNEIGIKFLYPSALESTQTISNDEIVRFEKKGIGTVVLSKKYYDLSMYDINVEYTDGPGCLRTENPVLLNDGTLTQYTRSFYYGGGECYLYNVEYLQSYTIEFEAEGNNYYLYYLQPWNTEKYNIEFDDDRFHTIYGYGNFTFSGIIESIETNTF